MQIGDKVLIRTNGEVKELTVIEILEEDLILQGESGEEIARKFWEVNKKR
jgi:hypothetical protein